MDDDINYASIVEANVYLREQFAGVLQKIDIGYQFTYAQTWLNGQNGPISISLPSTIIFHYSVELFPFFDNLIPEGWLLSYVQDIHRIDKGNRFALLMATGRYPIGAVSVIPLKDGKELHKSIPLMSSKQCTTEKLIFPKSSGICSYCLEEIDSRKDFHGKCIRQLWGTSRQLKMFLDPKEPLEVFRHTIYGASISGAQRKGLFQLKKGELQPSQGNEALFILKPPGTFSSLPENEHVTMCIAKKIGFDVPAIGLFKVPQIGNIFVIRRFDNHASNQWKRMEDFGQVLGYSSENKYTGTYNKIAKGIENYSDAALVDIVEFWKRLLFAFFIGNGDMHLKNWALLEQDDLHGRFRLSPCYDLLNTRLPLPKEQFELALPMDARQNKVNRKRFLEFAETLNILPFAEQVLKEELLNWMTVTKIFVHRSFLSEEQKEEYINIVEQRFQRLL